MSFQTDDDRRLMPPPSWDPQTVEPTPTTTLPETSLRSEVPTQQMSHRAELPDSPTPEFARMKPKHRADFEYVQNLPLSFYSRVNMDSTGLEWHTAANQSNNHRLYSWTFRQVSAEFSGRLPKGRSQFVVTVEGTFQPVDLAQQGNLLNVCDGTNKWRLYRAGDPIATHLSQYRSLLHRRSNTVEMMQGPDDFSFSCGPWSFGAISLQGFDDEGTPTVQVDSIPATFTIEEMPQSLF